MYPRHVNNLRLATTFFLRRAGRQGTRSGTMPPDVVFRMSHGRRPRRRLGPLARVLLGCAPALLLVGSGFVAHWAPGAPGSPSVHNSVMVGILLTAAAIVAGLGSVLGAPRRVTSYLILIANLAGIVVFFSTIAKA